MCVHWVYHLASGNLYQLIPKSLCVAFHGCPACDSVGQEFILTIKLGIVIHHLGFLSFFSNYWKLKTLTQKHFPLRGPVEETDILVGIVLEKK